MQSSGFRSAILRWLRDFAFRHRPAPAILLVGICVTFVVCLDTSITPVALHTHLRRRREGEGNRIASPERIVKWVRPCIGLIVITRS